MGAAFKYMFIMILLTIAVMILFAIIGLIGADFMGLDYDEVDMNDWFFSIRHVTGYLLVLFVFWQRRYTRFGFSYGYTFNERFSSRSLLRWVAVTAIGLLLFDFFYWCPLKLKKR